MAQADSVPSASRQLITGESANQSTNLPAVRIKPSDRSYCIGGSDGRVIMGTDEAPLLRVWWERRSDVEREDLSSRRWRAANAGQEPMGSNIGALSYETVGFLLGRLLRNILLILLRFLNRNKRLRLGSFDEMPSNQLVRSKPQGRLR